MKCSKCCTCEATAAQAECPCCHLLDVIYGEGKWKYLDEDEVAGLDGDL